MGRNSNEKDYFGADDPALIQMCLSCKRSSCHNCIETMTRKEKEALIRGRNPIQDTGPAHHEEEPQQDCDEPGNGAADGDSVE